MSTPAPKPANQVALAKVYHGLRGAKGKTHRSYLAFADQMMDELRELGFRIVPFPPLKAVKKRKAPRRA